MHETFLLCALERIISRIEIGYQNTCEVTQKLLEERTFPRWLVEVVHPVHAGHDPNVTFLLSKSHCGFINVDEWASHNAFEDFRVKGSVRINDVTLQPVQSVLVNRKTEHVVD